MASEFQGIFLSHFCETCYANSKLEDKSGISDLKNDKIDIDDTAKNASKKYNMM